MKDTYIKEGKILNSAFMYDDGCYELNIDDWGVNALMDIIDFCGQHEGSKVKITIEVEE